MFGGRKVMELPSLQLSLSHPSYTITILISITERRSVALTCSGFKSDSVSFFFHKSPKQV